MVIREEVQRILRNAERELAELAAEAGARRAYDDAGTLLDAARRVQQIGEQVLAGLADRTGVAERTDGDTTPGPEALLLAPAGPLPAADRPGSCRTSRKADYPQFFRDGDALVKVGWSKSEGTEYEHKCPRRALDVLVGECARVAGPGRRFVMDKLLPLRDPTGGAEVPDYQAYVALAFLRHAGLVEQHGRSGYSIPKAKSLAADAAAAWAGIAAR